VYSQICSPALPISFLMLIASMEATSRQSLIQRKQWQSPEARYAML
jgi:hypothetical protein